MTTNLARTSLALLTAVSLCAPAVAQELIAGRPPSPATPAEAKAEAKAGAVGAGPVVASPEELPPGTPTDDYEFMGWCTGILTGHMDLYDKVKPELTAISQRWHSVDEDAKQEADQRTEGKILLARFRKVMATAEASYPSLGPVGQGAIQKGMSSWAKIDTVDRRTQAYSWMSFGLPEQCESKVATLEAHPYAMIATINGKTTTVAAATGGKKKKAAKETYYKDDVEPVHRLAPPDHNIVAEEAAKAKAARDAKKAKAAADADSAGLRP